MGPWSVNPGWQNFSSHFRETVAAIEAQTDFEKVHHLTAALYFGISAIEAFLNREMREHLSPTHGEDEIFKLIRNSPFLKKLEGWPKKITGMDLSLGLEELNIIRLANQIRGDMTHPKILGPNIYDRLFDFDPFGVVDSIAKYIVAFHQAKKSRYPYWVFGWNYLNPSPNSYDIILLNEQQFCHSLAAIGFNISASSWEGSESWCEKYLTTLDGYIAVRDTFAQVKHCEPKFDRFPFQPKLCRRWWLRDHQTTCGNVSPTAIEAAQRYGQQ